MRPFVALAACLAAAGLAASGAPAPDPCEEAKRSNGWCEAAHAGYVAGVEVRSSFLFEVLDTDGHGIIPAEVKCETCRKALLSDGYCPIHRMGYAHGEAFMSALTWHLARARVVSPSTLTCRACRRHTRGIGWCDRDHVGIAGYFAVDDRREFEELAKEYDLLLAAIEKSASCEICAGAMITNGYCRIHRLTWRDGSPVDAARQE